MARLDIPEPVVERPRRPRVIIVISPHNAWTCASCGDTGDFLRMDKAGARCLDCADLGHLEFLPSGDAALTRRATKASRLSAVVVRWSTRRNRYERQGILVEPAAIERAAPECLSDAAARARHVDADYDALLMSGVDRESARAHVHQRVEDVVNAWRDGVAMLDG